MSSHVVGCSATDIQALTGRLNFFDPETIASAREHLTAIGYSFQQKGPGSAWPSIALDPSFTQLLVSTTQKQIECSSTPSASPRVVSLGSISKDSLYSEANEEAFTDLRELYGVGCSEMEASVLVRISRQKTLANDPGAHSISSLSLHLSNYPLNPVIDFIGTLFHQKFTS